MTILEALEYAADFELYRKKDDTYFGYGAINKFDKCNTMFFDEYWHDHYPKMVRILESIPWNIVKNPRIPEVEEYPTKDGTYITMLDCNEHEVLVNRFFNGKFSLYNKTHIKWWIPISDLSKQL